MEQNAKTMKRREENGVPSSGSTKTETRCGVLVHSLTCIGVSLIGLCGLIGLCLCAAGAAAVAEVVADEDAGAGGCGCMGVGGCVRGNRLLVKPERGEWGDDTGGTER